MSAEAEPVIPATPTRFQLWLRWFFGAVLLANYLRLIALTSRHVVVPADAWDWLRDLRPAIVVSWHGQSNLAYVYARYRNESAILTSTHLDGRIATALAQAFGYQTIDGSGMSERQRHGTGGLTAFRSMLKAIRAGTSLFLTADVPPIPGRQVSPGVIAVARRSGRPIVAMASSSSRRVILERVWDKMQFNLPFSRTSLAWEEPLWVTDPAISDETYADMLRIRLDRALERANAAADGKAG
ncbi:MAG: DUF374 domain-containing protein [Devosia sp.]|nr:DUF374 domain-containing protein [Devosia sp.]